MSNVSINSIRQASNAIIINPSKSLKNFGIDYFLLYTSPVLFPGNFFFTLYKRREKGKRKKNGCIRKL